MSQSLLATRVDERLGRFGLHLADEPRLKLITYLELLARWNRKINLTAFDLDAPTAAAIDRLGVEPLVAAQFVRATDRTAVDIGSGGGSPAIPLVVSRPHLRMTMVESRQKKAAFLREVVRTLEIDADVAEGRFEDVAGDWPDAGVVSVVSFRAIRADAAMLRGVERLLASDGMVIALGVGRTPEINRVSFLLRKYADFSILVGEKLAGSSPS